MNIIQELLWIKCFEWKSLDGSVKNSIIVMLFVLFSIEKYFFMVFFR